MIQIAPRTGSERPSLGDLLRLEGQVIIITGAAGALGRALAERFAEAGAALLLTDATLPDAEMTAATVAHRFGGSALAAALDVRDPVAATAVVERAQRELGGFDVLINVGSLALAYLAIEAAAETMEHGVVVNIDISGSDSRELAHALATVLAPRGVRMIDVAPEPQATPDEVARVAVLLASEAAAGITGATVPVAGSPH